MEMEIDTQSNCGARAPVARATEIIEMKEDINSREIIHARSLAIAAPERSSDSSRAI